MNENELRNRLTSLARSIRRPTVGSFDVQKQDKILFLGGTVTRKRIILSTSGCQVKTCLMCPFPNETAAGYDGKNIIEQFDACFVNDSIDCYDMITLFCNGNFFNDGEIAPIARQYIFNRIKTSKARFVVVESLPQYFTERQAKLASEQIGDKKLCLFMGLQSSNDQVRRLCVNTTTTQKNFENAVRLLQERSWIPMAFLMIKPPFLTEQEAIDDTVNSTRYLASLGVDYTTLCPNRVAPYTVADLVSKAGQYSVPWIWSVVDVLKQTHDIVGVTPMVNTSELKPEINPDSICCTNRCHECNVHLIAAIERYLFTRDITLLDDMKCDCYEHYLRFKQEEQTRWGNMTLPERVELFLSGRI